MTAAELRADAEAIWHAGVAAVAPGRLLREAFATLTAADRSTIESAERIHVVGCGKAGRGMAAGLEECLRGRLDRVTGTVNVPADSDVPLARIRLLAARPAGSNHPTAAGVAGADAMLAALAGAGPTDVAFCLISGGGSALLPAPAAGISLEDKQLVTKLLTASGADIGDMNAVRKHLSRVKGGLLAEAFRGKRLFAFVISDVVNDPLDVIASGPTVPDPTTFADAAGVLRRFGLWDRVPESVRLRFTPGEAGELPETPKVARGNVSTAIIGRNADALAAAAAEAVARGYAVHDLGPAVVGETAVVAAEVASLVRRIRTQGGLPACVLVGGETTVTLGPTPGKGGRNQEFALAAAVALGAVMAGVCVLSGGTDGEDGPTAAAGAVATADTLPTAAALGIDAAAHLAGHDAYPFFDGVGGLLKTGLTGTNVTDVRVILIR